MGTGWQGFPETKSAEFWFDLIILELHSQN